MRCPLPQAALAVRLVNPQVSIMIDRCPSGIGPMFEVLDIGNRASPPLTVWPVCHSVALNVQVTNEGTDRNRRGLLREQSQKGTSTQGQKKLRAWQFAEGRDGEVFGSLTNDAGK
jgi:hypothetical protein